MVLRTVPRTANVKLELLTAQNVSLPAGLTVQSLELPPVPLLEELSEVLVVHLSPVLLCWLFLPRKESWRKRRKRTKRSWTKAMLRPDQFTDLLAVLIQGRPARLLKCVSCSFAFNLSLMLYRNDFAGRSIEDSLPLPCVQARDRCWWLRQGVCWWMATNKSRHQSCNCCQRWGLHSRGQTFSVRTNSVAFIVFLTVVQ